MVNAIIHIFPHIQYDSTAFDIKIQKLRIFSFGCFGFWILFVRFRFVRRNTKIPKFIGKYIQPKMNAHI